MEVDMHSPFRETRSFSMKRRRSPEGSPSPFERHSKRMTFEQESAPSPTIPPIGGTNSSNTSRYSSEDWVKQTDDLRIDSPLIIGGGFFPAVAHNAGDAGVSDSMDDTMTLDSDETMGVYRPSAPIPRSAHRPHAPQIQINTIPSTHVPQPQYQNHLQQSSLLLSAPLQLPYASSPQPDFSSYLQPPTICVLSATPENSPLTPQDHTSHIHPHPEPQSSQSPMAMSPSLPATNRKQRFTMGPRTDCEKCRLGVKGHWMHFD